MVRTVARGLAFSKTRVGRYSLLTTPAVKDHVDDDAADDRIRPPVRTGLTTPMATLRSPGITFRGRSRRPLHRKDPDRRCIGKWPAPTASACALLSAIGASRSQLGRSRFSPELTPPIKPRALVPTARR